MSTITCKDLPWKIKLISSLSDIFMNLICRSDGTINRRLLSVLDYKVRPSVKPINGVKTSDIIVDPSRDLWFRLFIPNTTDDSNVNDTGMPVIVYFHGGGGALMAANSLTYDRLCRRFARELNAVIISVNYRLAPEHKYPCQCEDGFGVLKFIDSNPNFEGFHSNLQNCFLGGDSMGGNVAHHVAVKASNYDFSNLRINGVIAIQPGFRGEERTESEIRLQVGAPFLTVERGDWFWKAFLPDGSDRNHPATNVFGPKSVDISGSNFPATIVIVGGLDPLQDWQKRYYEGLKKSGKEAYLIEYPNAFHSFYAFPEVTESTLLINEVKDFMQKQYAKRKNNLSVGEFFEGI